jgi:RNA 2',3'-cyclic 3'-phosphodiesterase
MRLFVALALPQPVKDVLAALCQADIPAARWEHPADFHLTLRFIGDVDDAAYSRYSAALSAVEAAAFGLRLRGVGRFPPQSSRPARILWAGVEPSPELATLQARVSAALDAAGLPPDRHATYTPHITLARIGQTQTGTALDEFLQAHATLTSDTMQMSAFVLYNTARQADGTKFQAVRVYPLK